MCGVFHYSTLVKQSSCYIALTRRHSLRNVKSRRDDSQ